MQMLIQHIFNVKLSLSFAIGGRSKKAAVEWTIAASTHFSNI
jgi:hypothetical protein